jgi:Zinc carboxypeptidase/FlgD Ig-like domain
MPSALRSIAVSGVVLLTLLSLLASPAVATRAGHDAADPFREVRIAWSDVAAHRGGAAFAGLEIMHVERGQYVTVLARNAELATLTAHGIPHSIAIPDLEAHYAAQAAANGPGFGPFHTYSETVDQLDLLHATYPALTTARIALGTTWEGNTIWAMKISDHPGQEEPDEPEVLFDGVHHAREIMTVEMLLSFMEHLLSGYGVDPEITFLVDHRQIWFVPIVNPDGFLYNELTNPNGGGLWRKNRRNDLGPCIGVDPNRNYPFEWLGPGSDPDPCGETYRGPAPNSEAENQSLINFINQHEFVTHNTYHSVAGMVLFPWAYTLAHTPDDALFRLMADEMARDSNYQPGQPPEILYQVNGGFFDWTYGEQTTKPKIFSFSTEIGGSGFWPQPAEAPGLIAENLHSNLFLVRAAGPYPDLTASAVVGGNGNGRLDPGETADLVVTITNLGVIAPAEGVTVRLRTDDPYLALGDAESAIGTLAPLQSGTNAGDPFVVTADPTTPGGHVAPLAVEIESAGGLVLERDLLLTVGQAPILYSANFESGDGGFTLDPSHTATTGSFVRIDPNPTQFQPGDDTTPAPGIFAWVTGQNSDLGIDDVDNGVSATRSPLINLSGQEAARLVLSYFHGQRDPGNDAGDFFRIHLSNDGGATWPVALVSIGDVTTSPAWHDLQVDLEDLLPLTAQMRIRVQAADGVATGDIVEGGIDDVAILDSGSGNEAPGAPLLVSPPDGALGLPAAPTLVVANAVDPEGDPLTYAFHVYADPLLTTLVRSAAQIPPGPTETAWIVSPPLAPGTYYWRAHASDPELRGPFMPAAAFTVSGIAAADGASGAPRMRLAAATPNPFARATRVTYELAAAARVRLDLFDASGRHVRRLVDGVAVAGHHTADWDGRDTGGTPVAAGVYLAQLWVDGATDTQKLVRLE